MVRGEPPSFNWRQATEARFGQADRALRVPRFLLGQLVQVTRGLAHTVFNVWTESFFN